MALNLSVPEALSGFERQAIGVMDKAAPLNLHELE